MVKDEWHTSLLASLSTTPKTLRDAEVITYCRPSGEAVQGKPEGAAKPEHDKSIETGSAHIENPCKPGTSGNYFSSTSLGRIILSMDLAKLSCPLDGSRAMGEGNTIYSNGPTKRGYVGIMM